MTYNADGILTSFDSELPVVHDKPNEISSTAYCVGCRSHAAEVFHHEIHAVCSADASTQPGMLLRVDLDSTSTSPIHDDIVHIFSNMLPHDVCYVLHDFSVATCFERCDKFLTGRGNQQHIF